MKRFTILFLAICAHFALYPANLTAQTTEAEIRQAVETKLSPKMRMIYNQAHDLQNKGDSFNAALLTARFPSLSWSAQGDPEVLAFVKIAPGANIGALESDGIQKRRQSGDVITARINLSKIDAALMSSDVLRIEPAQSVEYNHNRSVIETRAHRVHEAHWISEELRGEDIIVGVIDSALDVYHPDFSDEDGSRVLWYMFYDPEQDIVEFSQDDINNEVPGVAEATDVLGHGTFVAGTAVGNGNAWSEYGGMAPRADLIFFGLETALNFPENRPAPNFVDTTPLDIALAEGVSHIFEKADELDRPAVVNISLGNHSGPHDGTSLAEQFISNQVAPGRIIVASAGNSGGTYRSAMANLSSNSESTAVAPFFRQQGDIEAWYDAGLIDSFRLAVYQSDVSGYTLIDETDWIDVGTEGSGEFFEDETLLVNVFWDALETENPENGDGNIVISADFQSGVGESIESFPLVITFRTTDQSGRINLWSGDAGFYPEDFGDIAENLIPGGAAYSIEFPATAHNVVVAGSYISKNQWVDFNGNVRNLTVNDDPFYGGGGDVATVGKLSTFSSKGPTRDGRMLPHLITPGEMIFSTFSESSSASSSEVLEGLRYVGSRGTSRAAAHVTGAIALMLQAKPDLEFERIIDIFDLSGREDEFTGTLPNNQAGFGKLHTELAVVYSKNFPTGTGDETLPQQVELYQNYPNPFNPVTQIRYELPQAGDVRLDVFNVLGQRVATLVDGLQNSGTHTVTFDASRLSSGVYIYRLRAGNAVITRKMMLVK